jgi:hypothetical protein
VPASMRRPASLMPGTSAVETAVIPLSGTSVGKTETEHDRVGALDLDRLVEVVDARSEEEVQSPGEGVVDRLRGVRWPCDVELADRDRRAGGRPACPSRAGRVMAQRRDKDAEAPGRVHVQERPLPGDWTRGQRRVRRRTVGRGRERLRRRPDHAREDLVPDAVRPTADAAVANEELLLRAVDDEACLRVSDEAAAGVLRPGGAVVHQRQVSAGDVDPPHRRCL